MKPRLAFVSQNGGGGRIRSHWPAQVLRSRGWNIVASRPDWPDPGSVDMIVMHRPLYPDNLDQVRAYRQRGVIVIVQEDDDLDGIPPSHFKPERKLLRSHDTAVAEADGLIVTTPYLADHYGPLAKHTWIVPNYLPGWIMSRAFSSRRYQEAAVRIGWAGVIICHRVDLDWIRPVGSEMFRGAEFVTVGDPLTPRMIGAGGVRCEVHPYATVVDQFYTLMGRADIGIVPLDPVWGLNKGKSWLKLLEYAMLGKPAVGVRGLPEQEAMVDHEVTGLLASTPLEFAQAVQRLVWDEEARVTMGRAAREKAATMVLEEKAHVWIDAMTEAWEVSQPRRSPRRALVGAGR